MSKCLHLDIFMLSLYYFTEKI